MYIGILIFLFVFFGLGSVLYDKFIWQKSLTEQEKKEIKEGRE